MEKNLIEPVVTHAQPTQYCMSQAACHIYFLQKNAQTDFLVDKLLSLI